MEKITLYFDMDGTIADLYGKEHWLESLLAEKPNLFATLEPMYDLKELKALIADFDVKIVTWTPKEVSEDYKNIVALEKMLWLKNNDFEFHTIALEYGTNKANVVKSMNRNHILVDDNNEGREMWKQKGGRVSNANHNIIEQLSLLK